MKIARFRQAKQRLQMTLARRRVEQIDPRTTRTIHVDTRYMLWIMEQVDGAQALIDEMDIVR